MRTEEDVKCESIKVRYASRKKGRLGSPLCSLPQHIK